MTDAPRHHHSILASTADAATAAGRAAERSGDLEVALDHFRAALAARPKALHALSDVARVLLALGRDAEAEPLLETARRLAPHNPRPLVGLADIAQRRGKAETALDLLAEAIARAPDDAGAQVRRAQLLAGLGRSVEAQHAYETALTLRPGDGRLQLLAGRLARRNGDLPAAVAHLRGAMSAGEPKAVAELAGALIESGAGTDAIAFCADAPAATQLAVARAARGAGRPDAAAALLRQALAASGTAEPTLLLSAAGEWQALGQPGEAARLLEQAIAARPEDGEIWLRLGLARRIAGETAAALEAFRRAAATDPDNVAPVRELCRTQLALGEAAAAEITLRRALGLEPDSVETLRLAVSVAQAFGDDEATLRIVKRIRDAEPESRREDGIAFHLLTRLGRWSEALALLDARDARDGPTSAVAALRARLLDQRGDPSAEQVLAAARAAWPEDAELWWQQVTLWCRRGAVEEAAAALASPPLFARETPARLAGLRALLAEQAWRPEEAAALCAEALRLAPEDTTAHERRARLLLLLNDPAGAMSHLRAKAHLGRTTSRTRKRTARPSGGPVGVRVNEYLLEPAIVADLRAAQALPMPKRLGRFAEIARSNPDHIAPAAALLLALRQAGLFDRKSEPAEGSCGIPRRIVQFWDRPDPPPDVQERMVSWSALNPGFAYRRFDNAYAAAWLREHHPPEVSRAFRAAAHPARKADIFRLAVLAAEGGFYADADDRCIGPLEQLLRPGTRFIALQETGADIGNNFLGAEPEHPVIVAALAEAVETTNRGDRGSVLLDTGPCLLSRRLVAYLLARDGIAEDRTRELALLDRAQGSAVIRSACAAAYKRTDLSWKRAETGTGRGQLGTETRALLGLHLAQRDGA